METEPPRAATMLERAPRRDLPSTCLACWAGITRGSPADTVDQSPIANRKLGFVVVCSAWFRATSQFPTPTKQEDLNARIPEFERGAAQWTAPRSVYREDIGAHDALGAR